jgi:hypothetical protein
MFGVICFCELRMCVSLPHGMGWYEYLLSGRKRDWVFLGSVDLEASESFWLGSMMTAYCLDWESHRLRRDAWSVFNKAWVWKSRFFARLDC